MSDKSKADEFYDLCYDVWRGGGNPDKVDRDRFDHYESGFDDDILRRELRRQHPPEPDYPEEQEQTNER
jgi:hypothetical protein